MSMHSGPVGVEECEDLDCTGCEWCGETPFGVPFEAGEEPLCPFHANGAEGHCNWCEQSSWSDQ